MTRFDETVKLFEANCVKSEMVNEHEFWKEIRKGIPKCKSTKPRVVPAFTIQALQKNTVVAKPPKCGLYEPRIPKPSTFRKYYDRGVFPIVLESDSYGPKIRWAADIAEDKSNLDYHHYLPLFFDGLTETEPPYKNLVELGISDMLQHGGSRILPVIPQLIIPIKKALNTKVPEIVCTTMRTLQRLVRSEDRIGEALVPYFRQILPIPNLLKDRKVNLGEGIDYAHQRGDNPADVIQETLEVLERYGGEDAFINIKYMVPTYESCIMK